MKYLGRNGRVFWGISARTEEFLCSILAGTEQLFAAFLGRFQVLQWKLQKVQKLRLVFIFKKIVKKA